MTVPVAPWPSIDRFHHEVLFYRHEADFRAAVLRHVCEGLALDESVVVIEPRPQLELLRGAMGGDAAAVRWLDVAEVGRNPARLVPLWQEALSDAAASGRGLRGVAETAHVGRRGAELAECRLLEALLGHAFEDGPAWRLLCPYAEELPPEVRAGAMRTHPRWTGPDGGGPNPEYGTGHVTGGRRWPTREPLSPPTDVVLRGDFGPRDVPAVRRTIRQYARSCGLRPDQVEALELAASELATNSVLHGGGAGSVAMWREPDAAVLEFSDAGRLTDPLAGHRRPETGLESGMGLYLVNQLCDLVQVRTSAGGTLVRVTTWI